MGEDLDFMNKCEGAYDEYPYNNETEKVDTDEKCIIDILNFLGSIKSDDCVIPEYDKICKIFLPPVKEKKTIGSIFGKKVEPYKSDPLYVVNEHLKNFYCFEMFVKKWKPNGHFTRTYDVVGFLKKRIKTPKDKPRDISVEEYKEYIKNYKKYEKTEIYKLLYCFSQTADFKPIDIDTNATEPNTIVKTNNESKNTDCYNYDKINKINKKNAENWNNILKTYHKDNKNVNLAESFYQHYCYYYFNIINDHLGKHITYNYMGRHRTFKKVYEYMPLKGKERGESYPIMSYMNDFFNTFSKRESLGGKRRRKKNRKTKRKNKRTKKFRKSKKKL